MFAIIETSDANNEKEVSIVSKTWIDGKTVLWPDKKNVRYLLESHATPTDTWLKYPYKLLQNNIETLTEAKKRERMFEAFSNSESEAASHHKKTKFKSVDLNNQFEEIQNCSSFIIENIPIAIANMNIQKGGHMNSTIINAVVNSPATIPIENEHNHAIIIENNQDSEQETIIFNQGINQDDHQSLNGNDNLGQLIRCNATIIPNYDEEGSDGVLLQNIKTAVSSILTKSISELTVEIKLLKNRIDEMENTVKPIVHLLPDLIAFMRKNTTNSIAKDPSFKSPKLPFSTINDVEQFNFKLIDRIFSDQMLIILKSEVEGRKVNKNIRNILEKLIEPETLHQFTWTGAVNIKKEKNKKAFSDMTHLISLIETTINCRFQELGFPEISKIELRRNFVDVLKWAAERYRYGQNKPITAA